jgi:hypothetical protein
MHNEAAIRGIATVQSAGNLVDVHSHLTKLQVGVRIQFGLGERQVVEDLAKCIGPGEVVSLGQTIKGSKVLGINSDLEGGASRLGTAFMVEMQGTYRPMDRVNLNGRS